VQSFSTAYRRYIATRLEPALPIPVLLSRRIRVSGALQEDARSWFGGRPRLGGKAWPHGSTGRPLYHLAQIDLTTVGKIATDGLLPNNGWLSFFHDEADGTDAAVVYVPGSVLPSFTAAPPNLGSFSGPDTLSLPYWPMNIAPMKGETKPPSRKGFRQIAAELFKAEDRPVWWHSAQQMANILQRSTRKQDALWERNRVKDARVRQLGEEEVRRREKALAEAEAENAIANRALPDMQAFAAEYSAWARANPPWSRMSRSDATIFADSYARFKTEFGKFSYLLPPAGLERLEAETLYGMIVGDAQTFAKLPAAIVNWLPEAEHSRDGFHQMFGEPMWTQTGFLRQSDLKDMHLLFQLVTDDMLAVDFGEAGAFQFFISPQDLAARSWARVLCIEGMI
jgi:hypothetical protein